MFYCGSKRIPALAENIGDTTRCSALVSGNTVIYTIEHLLAALYGLGVDNAEIHVTGRELPALDGSAKLFVDGLLRAGIRPQYRPAREVVLRSVVWAQDGDRHVLAIPWESLAVVGAVDFERPYAGAQSFMYALEGSRDCSEVLEMVGAASGTVAAALPPIRQPALEGGCALTTFIEELAPARTFCLEEWIGPLRAAGLGTGGSLENTLVLSERGPSTPLRFPDELARHKTLDLLGDMSLVGGRLRALVVAIKAGHSLHVQAARQIRRLSHGVDYPGS